VVAAAQERENDFCGGVVGVANQNAGPCHTEFLEKEDEFVHEGALVAVGKDDSLMDAASQRQGEEALCRLNHDSEGLAGVPEDVFGLGVILRLLVELLDRRHFASGFGSFDAVGKQDDASVDGEQKGVQDAENQTRP